ncbi:MAG: hypothetical protein IKR04_02985 [Clostridia bacterium]|nr:hypothetical protein [Clostridia bacterium]
MKKQMIILIVVFIVSLCNFAFAKNMLDNPIVSDYKNNSIIDTRSTRFVHFKYTDSRKLVYCNLKVNKLHGNRYAVSIASLTGTQNIIIKDSRQNELKYTYYLSDSKGKINDYELVTGKDLNVYVTTYKGVQIVYTDTQEESMKSLKKYLDMMPAKMLVNLKQILMIPYSNTSCIAGSTKDTRITLYNFAKYDEKTQKNILFHEATHTYANKLIDEKKIDSEYTAYKKYVDADNNYVSSYSKEFYKSNNGKLSEDFADGFAFYLIDEAKFKEKYPNRTKYIENILKM